jgi:hypothetical protein
MTNEIELHDSKLLSVDINTGTLLIDAYVYRSGPGIERQVGRQNARFRFSNFKVESESGELAGDIYKGTLAIAGLDSDYLIALPTNVSNSVEMKLLLLPDGVEATFFGDGLVIEEAGPYRFIEFWPI